MTTRPLWRGRTLALLGIVLFAFSLRSAVASLSPVVAYIEADFTVPAWVLGLIATAPPACFAASGLFAPALERRLGLERLGVIAVLVVAVGLAGRGLSTGPVMLLVTTALIFAGVGVGNVLMPPLVKTYFPDRIGPMTALFTTTMAFSTFLPPLFAVPVADTAGWQLSLGMWAVFALLATVPWIILIVRHRDAEDADLEQAPGPVFGRLWRLPLAWAVTVTFLVSSSIAYTGFAWLPDLLIDTAGVTPAQAGVLLALFGAMGLPGSLLVPVLVARIRAVVPVLYVVSVALGLAGVAGLLFAPAAAPWLWVALLGLVQLYFPLALVLLGLRTRTHEGSVALSAFVQSLGYAIAAVVPFAIGMLYAGTGSWTWPLLVLAVVILASIPAGIVAVRARTIEDEWEHRHGAWR
ncbi:CynX/NimT family MFS transporter [Microbacterium invictum]|uniref:CP family cyanate transporter-like MFS transporter n=1 Tax=Microbacterium invictum TaxID=515415 RepID=A0AA40SQG7_9MICO|nr:MULTISPECIES: MFS transporter [Microbacterium]MBB4140454.1 CP family cyanate transporter-like MFS transporter [Microbacterium invictum]